MLKHLSGGLRLIVRHHVSSAKDSDKGEVASRADLHLAGNAAVLQVPWHVVSFAKFVGMVKVQALGPLLVADPVADVVLDSVSTSVSEENKNVVIVTNLHLRRK